MLYSSSVRAVKEEDTSGETAYEKLYTHKEFRTVRDFENCLKFFENGGPQW